MFGMTALASAAAICAGPEAEVPAHCFKDSFYEPGIYRVLHFEDESGLSFSFRTVDGGITCKAWSDTISHLVCSNGKTSLRCDGDACRTRSPPERIRADHFGVGGAGTILRLTANLDCLIHLRVVGCQRSDGSTFAFTYRGYEAEPPELEGAEFFGQRSRP